MLGPRLTLFIFCQSVGLALGGRVERDMVVKAGMVFGRLDEGQTTMGGSQKTVRITAVLRNHVGKSVH